MRAYHDQLMSIICDEPLMRILLLRRSTIRGRRYVWIVMVCMSASGCRPKYTNRQQLFIGMKLYCTAEWQSMSVVLTAWRSARVQPDLRWCHKLSQFDRKPEKDQSKVTVVKCRWKGAAHKLVSWCNPPWVPQTWQGGHSPQQSSRGVHVEFSPPKQKGAK